MTETTEELYRMDGTLIGSGDSIKKLAVYSKSNLSAANLSDANLSDANLSDADLHNADLRGAKLIGATLIRATLCGADLRKADFSGADLSDADLIGTDLSGANLRGANLKGADLRDINLRGVILSECIGDSYYIISMQTDIWPIIRTADVMQIGCERHKIVEWWSFSDARISKMDRQALAWWRRWKPLLQQMIETYPAVPTGHEEDA